MDDRTQDDIDQRLSNLERTSVTYREGVVSDIDPLIITLAGGEEISEVRTLNTWDAMPGDRVAVLKWYMDLIVLPGVIT